MGDRLVRWGLPRAANAVPYLMGFITAAVATVLVATDRDRHPAGADVRHVALLLLVALFVGLRTAGREATLDLDTPRRSARGRPRCRRSAW